MDGLNLLVEAQAAGLTVVVDDGQLRIRGPSSAGQLVQRLIEHKADVLAALTNSPAMGGNGNTSPKTSGNIDLPLPPPPQRSPADYPDPWAARGYFPVRRIIRNGIEHKREDCRGQRGWRHVWGGTYCCGCWPCTDLAAMVPEESRP